MRNQLKVFWIIWVANFANRWAKRTSQTTYYVLSPVSKLSSILLIVSTSAIVSTAYNSPTETMATQIGKGGVLAKGGGGNNASSPSCSSRG
jgi:hypothetical protein